MMGSKRCCCHCKAETTQLRNGWRFVNGSFAKLCETCSSEYENDTFCAKFHLQSDGWRNCCICGKLVHCGCIVSLHMYEALDMGGIGCLRCTRQAMALIPIQNPSSMTNSGVSLSLRNPSEANYFADTDEVISGARALQNHPMMSSLHSTPTADQPAEPNKTVRSGTSSDHSIAENNEGESSADFVCEALRLGTALRSVSTGSPSQVALSLLPQPYNNQKKNGIIQTETGPDIAPFEGTNNSQRTSAFVPYVRTNKAAAVLSDSSASAGTIIFADINERHINNLVDSHGQLGQARFSNRSDSLQLFPSSEAVPNNVTPLSPILNQTASVPIGDLAGDHFGDPSTIGNNAADLSLPDRSNALIPCETAPRKTALNPVLSLGRPAQISPLAAANRIVMISKEPNSTPPVSAGKNKPNNPLSAVSYENSSQTPPLPVRHYKRKRSGSEAQYTNKSARQQSQSSADRLGHNNNNPSTNNPNEASGKTSQGPSSSSARRQFSEQPSNYPGSVPFVVSSDIFIPQQRQANLLPAIGRQNPKPYVALDPGAVYAQRNNIPLSNTEVEPGKPFLRLLFEKELSMTGALLQKFTRLSLPKLCVEAFFPVITEGRSMYMTFEDTNGVEWEFRYSYWKNGSSRMYGLDGMKDYRTRMKWKAGDLVTFHKVEPNGKYIIGTKKVVPDTEDMPD